MEVIERALMDYVLITKRMVGRLKNAHVFRGVAAGMSDHFLVEAKVVVAKEWGNRVVGCKREVVKVEELKIPEKFVVSSESGAETGMCDVTVAVQFVY